MFENVEKFRYLGVTVTNTKCIREEIKRRINVGNACYYSLEKILSSRLFFQESSSECSTQGQVIQCNSGFKPAVLPKGRSSTANSGTKVAVLLGMDRCGIFPLLSTLSLSSEQTLKDLKRFQGHQRGGEESGFG